MNIPEFYKQIGLELSPSGERWKATCPFHKEQDASFTVYSDGGYHCFGCGAHGTAKDIQENFDLDWRPFPDLLHDTKDHVIAAVSKLKQKMETELILLVTDKPKRIKFKAYNWFDSTFIDARSLANEPDSTLLDVTMFVHKKIGRINKYFATR